MSVLTAVGVGDFLSANEDTRVAPVPTDAGPFEDEWLARYVRSAVSRTVALPDLVEVSAFDGRVILRGEVGTAEIVGLVEAVACLPEVRGLYNLLEVRVSG